MIIVQVRGMWQVGENELMSRGALALAGTSQLMQMELILICLSYGHESRVPNGGTGTKMYQKMVALPQNFFKSQPYLYFEHLSHSLQK